MSTLTGDGPAAGTATAQRSVDLAIGGMTCASCAARIEKKLNRLDGVTATVNFATEQARVTYPDRMSPRDLVTVVEQAGYTATLPAARQAGGTGPADQADEASSLRRRLVISAVLTVPVVVLAFVPALQFRYYQWLSLVLATPVWAWGAWPFHKAAWASARHRATTMDTLISVGVTYAPGSHGSVQEIFVLATNGSATRATRTPSAPGAAGTTSAATRPARPAVQGRACAGSPECRTAGGSWAGGNPRP